MLDQRTAGTLLHITSLPGAYGCGDLGEVSKKWIDWLARTGQKWWQMLPLDPPGPGFSPYSSQSAFAINPMLISLDQLVADGVLERNEINKVDFPEERQINWVKIIPQKWKLLSKAALAWNRDKSSKEKNEFENFVQQQKYWLPSFAQFCVYDEEGKGDWYYWPEKQKQAQVELGEVLNKDRAQVYLLTQWWAHQQWEKLKGYAQQKNIKLLGDIPLYISHHSADVWQHQSLFKLYENGASKRVAGVPPDYFNPEGQLWGMPLFDWHSHEEDQFRWWKKRLKTQLSRFDQVRLDHFRGIVGFWEIPASAQSAKTGWWRKGPGSKLLEAFKEVEKTLPLIAEDLGIITKEVNQLRKEYSLPGMRVLQFAFSGQPDNPHLPTNHEIQQVIYTGTHDNDTAEGWFTHADANERDLLNKIAIRQDIPLSDPVHIKLIKLALGSRSRLVVIPAQDWLGLGSEARMNIPGTPEGNWRWKLSSLQWTDMPDLWIKKQLSIHKRRV